MDKREAQKLVDIIRKDLEANRAGMSKGVLTGMYGNNDIQQLCDLVEKELAKRWFYI